MEFVAHGDEQATGLDFLIYDKGVPYMAERKLGEDFPVFPYP